jgi:4-hydroxy-3-methylbut-2-enyl diphosphate reductase
MGVRRAVDMVLDASNLSKGPIFTYGPLIHNPQVLQMLEEKKIFRLDKIPETGTGIVLIRAHGVPPEDEKALAEAGFNVVNATCPRVVRVQAIISRFARKGYSTIIAGDKKHPEVIGLLGYAAGNGHTITTMQELKNLPVFEKAVVVAQTTQNTGLYSEIKQWCAKNASHYEIFDTICGSTEKRQAEIRELAEESDAVIVIGGRQSGNTKRLAQIAAMAGKPAFHIENASEIEYDKLAGARSLAITAGASTPNWIINDTCSKIENHLNKRHAFKSFLYLVRNFLLKTNIMAAAGAGFLTYACSKLQSITHAYPHTLISMLYVLSMQVLNNLFTVKSDRYNHPGRAAFYEKHRASLWMLAVVSGAAGLYLSFITGLLAFVILLVMSLLGLSYNLKILPFVPERHRIARIKDIPGSKTILITLAWGIVTCILPAVANGSPVHHVAVPFIFATGLVFARTAFFDVLAIQGDRITGKETLPVLVGEKRSMLIIQCVLFIDLMALSAASISGFLASKALLLAFIPFIMIVLIRFFKKGIPVSGMHQEFIIESVFIAAGLTAFLI